MFLNVGSLPYVVEQELRKALPVCEKEPEYAPKPDTSMQEHEAYMRKVQEDIARQTRSFFKKKAALKESSRPPADGDVPEDRTSRHPAQPRNPKNRTYP